MLVMQRPHARTNTCLPNCKLAALAEFAGCKINNSEEERSSVQKL